MAAYFQRLKALKKRRKTVVVYLVLLFEFLGILTAMHAVMNVRTPQGSIAWAVSLVTIPVVTVPAYWIFGRNKFHGYVLERRADADRLAVVAIDGKALRHSFDAFNDQKAAHVLSAFSVDDALILGHLEVDEKSNEIPAAQDLIEALALQGRLYTMDAMHCQKNF